ncbi:hypothetical protein [Kutzneria kofuensis]|uniref:ABC-type antimicrobial peptide transport system permease subunit n=1 Tax=Kutzneria kofuensis TaxID=103725 RepID=A0A7W9KK48_9PSEU|nr:hypothetical protein [Kutzneria kofuensis]MBB5893329.1 ABC-type antimicrobial peptide transport system permease subunit [Kutzneria kofuensis]
MAETERRGGPRLVSLLFGIGGLFAMAYALSDGKMADLPFGVTGLVAGGAILVGLLILMWTVRPSARK